MCLNLLFVNSLLLSWWNFHYVTLVWSDSDRLEMQSSCNGLDQKSRNKLSKLFHFVTELCLKSLTKQARFLISLNRPIRSNNLPSLALIKAGRYRLMDQFSLRPRVRIPSKLYCIYSQHCIFLWKGRKGAWFYPHLLILPFVWNCIAFINFNELFCWILLTAEMLTSDKWRMIDILASLSYIMPIAIWVAPIFLVEN